MERAWNNPDNGAAGLRRFHICKQLVTVGLILAAASLACNFQASKVGYQVGPVSLLDEQTLDRLEISVGKSGQAQPGDRLELKIGTTECCYVFQPVNVKTRWSVDPSSGAEIDPKTGVMEISSGAAAGTTFIVTVDIQDGRKTLTTQIKVYTPQANPLVGVWHEAKQINCESNSIQELPGKDSLRELVFKADGTFQATFMPFEVYHDYWGTYTFDLANGSLELVVQTGNSIPENLDLQGNFQIDENGALSLQGLWLGRREKNSPTGCGHVFTK